MHSQKESVDDLLNQKIIENQSQYLYQPVQTIQQTPSGNNLFIQISDQHQTKIELIKNIQQQDSNVSPNNNDLGPPSIYIFEPHPTTKNINSFEDNNEKLTYLQTRFQKQATRFGEYSESERSIKSIRCNLLEQKESMLQKRDIKYFYWFLFFELIFGITILLYIFYYYQFLALGYWNKGTDLQGNICGTFQAQQYGLLYFYNPQPNFTNQRICVRQCPETDNEILDCFYKAQSNQCKQQINIVNPVNNFQIYTTFNCIFIKQIDLNSVCIPKNINYYYKTEEQFNFNTMKSILADLWKIKYSIFLLFLISIICKELMEKMIKISISKIIISCIILIGLIGIGGIYFFQYYIKLLNIDNIEDKVSTLQVDYAYVAQHTIKSIPMMALLLSLSLITLFYIFSYGFYQSINKINLLYTVLKLIRKFHKSKKMIKITVLVNISKFMLFIIHLFGVFIIFSNIQQVNQDNPFENNIIIPQYIISFLIGIHLLIVYSYIDCILNFFTCSMFLEWYSLTLLQQQQFDTTQLFSISIRKTFVYQIGTIIALQSQYLYFTVKNYIMCCKKQIIYNNRKKNQLSIMILLKNCSLEESYIFIQQYDQILQPPYQEQILKIAYLYQKVNQITLGLISTLLMYFIQQNIYYNELYSLYPGLIISFLSGFIISCIHIEECEAGLQTLFYLYFADQELTLMQGMQNLFKRREKKKIISLIERQIEQFIKEMDINNS